MLTSIQRHCRTSGKVVHSDGKTEWWTFWILSRWFQPREIPEHLNRFYRNQVCSCDQQEIYNQDTKIWIKQKENGAAQKKLEFLFFWNSNFWSIQLPKSYGFFPLNWKSKEIWEKMPVNYPSCRRIFMNFGNFWVQEKKIPVKNCRFWGGKLEFLFFWTLTFWGHSNF